MISCTRIGGIWWLKVGRLCFSFCITKNYRGFARRRLIEHMGGLRPQR